MRRSVLATATVGLFCVSIAFAQNLEAEVQPDPNAGTVTYTIDVDGPPRSGPKLEIESDKDGNLIIRPKEPAPPSDQIPDNHDGSVDPINNPELFKQCPDCKKEADAVDQQQAALDKLNTARGPLVAKVAAAAATKAAADAAAKAAQTALDNFNNPKSSASSGDRYRDSSDLAAQRYASGQAWKSYRNGDMTAQALQDFWNNFDDADLAKAKQDLKARLEAQVKAAKKAVQNAQSQLDVQATALGKLDAAITAAQAKLNELKKKLQDCLEKCKKGQKKSLIDSFFDIFVDLSPTNSAQPLTEAEAATQLPPIGLPIPQGFGLGIEPGGDFNVDSFFDIFVEIDLPDDPSQLGPQQLEAIKRQIDPPLPPSDDFQVDSFFDVFFEVAPEGEPQEVPIELVELSLQGVGPIVVDGGKNDNWLLGPVLGPQPEFDLTLPDDPKPAANAGGGPAAGPQNCPRCKDIYDKLDKARTDLAALQGAQKLLQAKVNKTKAAVTKAKDRVQSLKDALDRMENPASWAESEGRRTNSADLEARRQALADAWSKYRTGQLTADQLENYWENFSDADRDAWKAKIKKDLKDQIDVAEDIVDDLEDVRDDAQDELDEVNQDIGKLEQRIKDLEKELTDCLKKCSEDIGLFKNIGGWFSDLFTDNAIIGRGVNLDQVLEDVVEASITNVRLLPPSPDPIAPTDPATNQARELIFDNLNLVIPAGGKVDIMVDIPTDTSQYDNLKIETNAEGNLVISNIGSSGQDGVDIDLGSEGQNGVAPDEINFDLKAEDGPDLKVQDIKLDITDSNDQPFKIIIPKTPQGDYRLDFTPNPGEDNFFIPAPSVQRDSNGNLIISNLGSSGQDGVSIDLDNTDLSSNLLNPNPTVRDFATGGGVFDPRGGLNGFDLPVVGLTPEGGVVDPHGTVVQVHPDGTFTFTPNLEVVPDTPPEVAVLPPTDGEPVVEGSRVQIKLEATDDGLLLPIELETDTGLFINQTPPVNNPPQLIVPDGWTAPNGVPARPPVGFDPILDLQNGLGGGGTFAINPDGQLVISNLGSSGQDGVQILPPAPEGTFQFDGEGNLVDPNLGSSGQDGIRGPDNSPASSGDWYAFAQALTGDLTLRPDPIKPPISSQPGETMLPEEGDYALGFDADPFLNYVGNFLNSDTTAPDVNFTGGSDPFRDAATAYRGEFGGTRIAAGQGLFPDIDLALPGDDGVIRDQDLTLDGLGDVPEVQPRSPRRRVVIIIIIKKKNVAPPTFIDGFDPDDIPDPEDISGDPASDFLGEPSGNDLIQPGLDDAPIFADGFESGDTSAWLTGDVPPGKPDSVEPPEAPVLCPSGSEKDIDCSGRCKSNQICEGLSTHFGCYRCQAKCEGGTFNTTNCGGQCDPGQQCIPSAPGSKCYECIGTPNDISLIEPEEKPEIKIGEDPVETCTPSCSGKVCGDDGCGGSCGSCASGQSCSASGQCEADEPDPISCNANFYEIGGECASCPADCTAPLGSVGVDSCSCPTAEVCNSHKGQYENGSCLGNCNSNQECISLEGTDCFSCEAKTPPACVPECNGKQCGGDGCGGSCGLCDNGMSCNSSGQCESDAPSCPAGTGDESACNAQCDNGACNDQGGGCFSCLQCDSGSFSTQSACEAGGDTCEVGGSQGNLSCWIPKASCTDVCTGAGYSAEPIDFTSQVESQLNAQNCVSSYSMNIQQITAGDCTCYPTEPPSITFDTTPPRLRGDRVW